MQLRKLIRLLENIKEEHGDRIRVSIQTEDFQNPVYDLQEINEVGISECFYEDENGWRKDNSTFVVSIGLESPNYKTFK